VIEGWMNEKLRQALSVWGRGRTKSLIDLKAVKVIRAPRGPEWSSCGRARMVGDEGRSRKPRVTLERKITWERNSREDGGLYSWQSGEGGAIPDQMGRLEL
jgi:hypothetical protein